MDYLADTVALIRYIERHPALGQRAKRILQETDEGVHRVFISGVTLMETLYLSEARKISLNLHDLVGRINTSVNYHIYPMDAQVVIVAATIDDVRELHDRIIAGTAKHLNVPILTSDQSLTRSRYISTVW